ncbi:hypothetical protein [Acidithiobacillus sp.]
MNSGDDLDFARGAPLDGDFLRRVETLVMGSVNPGHIPRYAEDWEETERLIGRLGDQGVGVRLEYSYGENGQRCRAYLDWQDAISHEWQTAEAEEGTAPQAVTRAALVWYYQQEVNTATAQPPDGWAYFEVVERVGMTRDLFARALEEHPVLAEEPDLQVRYQEILDKLNELYERVNQALDRRLEMPARGAMH